ncbi:hypothetical protein HMPREF1391_00837 [Helicobacter pylori GAM100Ai]|uniref:Uncharacterized protein n=1 Tax=Helicobacter pylori GAM100Ai TaxID=1159019 RepID=A0AB72ZUS8_HELPX|nr:hypothetical protein HMPREF1391_00837 [Helicobacter pylori GAM100Ai]
MSWLRNPKRLDRLCLTPQVFLIKIQRSSWIEIFRFLFALYILKILVRFLISQDFWRWLVLRGLKMSRFWCSFV